jgi:hypothetical protein
VFLKANSPSVTTEAEDLQSIFESVFSITCDYLWLSLFISVHLWLKTNFLRECNRLWAGGKEGRIDEDGEW